MEDLKPYPKYKTTKLNWLNQVPIDWDVKRTAALFHEKKTLNKEYQFKQAFQFKFGEIVNKKQIGTQEELKETYQKYTIVDKDDIVINGLNLNYDFLTQRVGKVRESGIITSAYISISPQKEEIEPRYACYLLKTLDNRKMLNGMGTGIRLTLSFPELKKQYLPLPTLSEQIQIANYLDYKVALINKFIKDKKKEIILLKEQKQAEINQAVTRGVNPNAKMKDSGISWIGEIPEHWDKRYLFQLSEEQKQSNKSIKNQNLLSLSYGRIINKDINSTAGLLPASFDTYQIVNNGNIILRLTDLQNDHKSLRVGLTTQTGIITSAYTCLKVKDTINPEYLYFALHTYDILKVFYGMGGGLRQSIGFKEIRKLIFNLPSLDEQQEIITHIRSIDDRIEIAVSAIENQIKLIQEYKTSLISDVVTGKVDVRNIVVENTEDEPEEDVEEMEDTEEIENSEE